jgi:hypothetical protein
MVIMNVVKNQIEELEERLENIGLTRFLQERLAKDEGARLNAEEFLKEIEMGGFIEQLSSRD